MKVFINLFLIVVCCYEISVNAKVRYDNFKVYRLTPQSRNALDTLKSLEDTQSGYDFWTGVKGIGYPVDIMIPPSLITQFNDTIINKGGFDTTVLISDVQKLINNEKPKGRKVPFAMEWANYHRLEEINQFLKDLAAQYPDRVSLLLAGRSYEGRDILGVKVSFQNDTLNENRTVFIEANIHAREWITSAVATWILNELLTSEDSNVRQVAESHDWYVVPVFNPDGFEYTHTTNRMWRKTRTPYPTCYGVDPNRNWGYHFNDGGSSSSPCSDTFRGPYAFSETSTRTLSEFIKTIGTRLRAYIGLHSYGQVLLIPYGYSPEHLENYDDLYNVGVTAMESLAQRHNTPYRVGNIVEALYVASGGSMDWVKGTFGTPITYTYELRDTGTNGFILPPAQILPCAEETLDSLVTMLQEFDNLLD